MKFSVKRPFSVHVKNLLHKIPAGEFETKDTHLIGALKNCQGVTEIKPIPKQPVKKSEVTK